MTLFSALAGSALLLLAAPPPLAQATTATQESQAAPAQSPLAVQSVPAGGGDRMPATPEMRAARQGVRSACAADMESLCKDAPAPTDGSPAARGRMQCIRAHAAQLSPPCRQALMTMRDARKAAKS